MSGSIFRTAKPSSWWSPVGWWSRLADRHPLIGFCVVIVWPNVLWSIANLLYNLHLIVEVFCDPAQERAFKIASVSYTVLSWTIGIGIIVWLMWPLIRFYRSLSQGGDMPLAIRRAAQRRLINMPVLQLFANFLLWLPGGLFFPTMIYVLGGANNWSWIAVQFMASFTVSAVVTTFQAFVFLERFLLVFLYPKVFTDVRPAEIEGAIILPFQMRLWLLWGAVAIGPMVVLVLIAVNLLYPPPNLKHEDLVPLTLGVVIFAVVTGGMIFWSVGRDMAGWLARHMAATREITRENFDVRINELRSDQWGRLTDSFNRMAEGLSRGMHVRETFGQFVGPEMADEILRNYSGLGGQVQEITVMFADIRGFTTRSAGKSPEEVVRLLNRFLSLAVQAIEEKKWGSVNKFLGDGFMALFGALPRPNHADLALLAAQDLLRRLDGLNHDLRAHGEAPLKIGIGIHTGLALVGSIGATVPLPNGRHQIRGEFTAIGETVNMTQRIEELTKTCGETLLISEATRQRLQSPPPLKCLGPQAVRGSPEPIVVHALTTLAA